MKLQQVSFAAGELSPEVSARVDLARYQIGLKSCKDFVVRTEGGVTTRPGTVFVGALQDQTASARLIAFVRSIDQAYLLECGGGYIRPWFGGAPLGGSVLSTPYALNEVDGLSWTQSADVMTLVHSAYHPREVRRTSGDSFEFAQPVYDYGPFMDVNPSDAIFVHSSATVGTVTLTATGSIFQAGHVGGLFYLDEWRLSEVRPWEPAEDITHFDLRRSDGKVYRASNTNKTGTIRPTHQLGSAYDGSTESKAVLWEYLHSGRGILRITEILSPSSATATTITRVPESCVGGITLKSGPYNYTGDGTTTEFTCTGITNIDRTLYEVSVDGVIQAPDTYEITASIDKVKFYSPPADDAAIVVKELSKNRRTTLWAFGSWSTKNGYPTETEYFGDRHVFASTPAETQSVWFSKVGDYKNFSKSVPVVDDDAVIATLSSRKVTSIQDLLPMTSLIVLASDSEWQMTTGEQGVITPTSVGFKPLSGEGTKKLPSIIVNDTLVFYTHRSRQVREMAYTLERDGFGGVELSIMSSHLMKGHEIVDWTLQYTPDKILWMVREDGTLLSLTYVKEHEVIGWARHEVAGGFVERVCAIPEGDRDVVYMVVRRTISGATVRYIEKLANPIQSDQNRYVQLDSSLSYDGPPENVFTNLSHLEGQTVSALADGVVVEGLTVQGGSVTLPFSASFVTIGLPYYPELETLEVNQSRGAPIRSNMKSIPQVAVTMLATRGIWVGPDADHLEPMVQRTDENYDEAIRPKTGVEVFYPPTTWSRDGRIFIRQTYPLPATILAIIPDINTGGSG